MTAESAIDPSEPRIYFEIDGLPRRTNNMGRDWPARAAEAKRWQDLVRRALLFCAKPRRPLLKAKLTLTRYSSQCPDFDGLVSGFKHVIDGLRAAKVLANDKIDNIGQPAYRWVKAKPRQGKISVLVEWDEA